MRGKVNTGQTSSFSERFRARLKQWHSPTTKTVDQINSMPTDEIPVYLEALNKRERRRQRNRALSTK